MYKKCLYRSMYILFASKVYANTTTRSDYKKFKLGTKQPFTIKRTKPVNINIGA